MNLATEPNFLLNDGAVIIICDCVLTKVWLMQGPRREDCGKAPRFICQGIGNEVLGRQACVSYSPAPVDQVIAKGRMQSEWNTILERKSARAFTYVLLWATLSLD